MIHDAFAYQLNLQKHSVYQDAYQVARIIAECAQGSILDLGSGTGILAKELQSRGMCVYQLEGAREMLKIAKDEDRVCRSLIQGNVVALPYKNGCMTSVVLSFVLHHLDSFERRLCLQECHRVLEKHGKLFIIDRIPRCRIIHRLFPLYWHCIYKHQHQWYEERPRLRTQKMLRAELQTDGFAIRETRTIHEPLNKILKRVTIPKTVILAVRTDH